MTTRAYITYGDRNLVLFGYPIHNYDPCIVLLHEYLDGWYSTPDLKVTQTERQTGHGAFPVKSSDVLYGARTVTAKVVAFGRNREEVIEEAALLNEVMGQLVTFRVRDDIFDTYVTGYCKVEWEAERFESSMDGTLTVVCPDPRRYSSITRTGYLSVSGSSSTNGLMYDETSGGLMYPIGYSHGETIVRNVCTIPNIGSAVSYPVIKASGNITGFALTDVKTGGQLTYSGYIGTSPMIFDCLSHTVSCNGVDMTRNLVRHSFPSIPAWDSLTLNLIAGGWGTVVVESHDAYI